MGLDGNELRSINEVRDALGSSLDLREVVGLAVPLLLRIVPADYVAFGTTKPGLRDELDWIATEMPAQFFDSYADMAPHDFVLRAVLEAPNQVLRDSEMISRRDLESNVMYGRARDLGMPIEHVMSAMLHAGADWRCGVSLYRSERRPFSERDRAVLEELIPALKNAVRNCHVHARMVSRAHRLETRLREVAETLSAPGIWRDRLTGREYEVADRFARGWDNRLVAEDLGCAEWTVRTHAKRLFPKLGVEAKPQLIILAVRGLLSEMLRDGED